MPLIIIQKMLTAFVFGVERKRKIKTVSPFKEFKRGLELSAYSDSSALLVCSFCSCKDQIYSKALTKIKEEEVQ